jgi:hypothetical protein
MKKFLVLYHAPAASYEQMMKATPEQRQAGMKAWMGWAERAKANIVDLGAPLGKGQKVTPTSAADQANTYGGYSVLQADSKEALAKVLEGHPHFMMPDGWIETVEVMPIPGM